MQLRIPADFRPRGKVDIFIHSKDKIKTFEDFLSFQDSVRRIYDFEDPDRIRLTKKQIQWMLNDHFKPRGIKDFEPGKNKIVDIGIKNIWSTWMNKTSDTYYGTPSYHSVGTSSTAAAAGDTQLVAQVERVAITRTFTSGLVANLDAFWNETQGNGTLNEVGLHWSSSGDGNLIARRVFASSKSKTSADTMTTKWDLTGASAT